MSRRSLAAILFSGTVLLLSPTSEAQTAYGINQAGTLFRFEIATPDNVTEIGPVGFVPEGIDFRPGTTTLYAIDVGPNTTQMYTIDINSAAPTPVGAGFSSSGPGYDLTGNQTFGFDFNPTTLQADNSMRIRLVSTAGVNLRLHSATGQIVGVDGNLQFPNGSVPFVDGSAYINNRPTMGGPTRLYNLDSRNDALLLQDPPNAGTVNLIGSLGLGVDALAGIGFDIYTDPNDVDPGIGGDTAYAVFLRVPSAVGEGFPYLLQTIDLATGAASNGVPVGGTTFYDFVGGFAVVPEPAGCAVVGLGLFCLATRRVLRVRR